MRLGAMPPSGPTPVARQKIALHGGCPRCMWGEKPGGGAGAENGCSVNRAFVPTTLRSRAVRQPHSVATKTGAVVRLGKCEPLPGRRIPSSRRAVDVRLLPVIDRTLRSGDLQKILRLTRTQVRNWTNYLAAPPPSPPSGTGRYAEYSPRNALDFALMRELVDRGISLPRIRTILQLCRNEPYDRPSHRAPACDYLILYRDPTSGRRRFVGRAKGEGKGIRWWHETSPDRTLHEFTDARNLRRRLAALPSATVVNVTALRRGLERAGKKVTRCKDHVMILMF